AQYFLRFNHLHPPFDDVRIRRAALVALGQEPVLKTQVGVPGLYKVCASLFPCGTPFAAEGGGGLTGIADPKKAKALLDEAGYKGQPVVLLRTTDLAIIAKLPLVVKQQLDRAGFKVDMQSMDWQTLVARRARKDAPSAGGWNAFASSWTTEDIANPLSMAMMNATGDKGWFGWQDDPTLEAIKSRFAAATSDADRRKFAAEAQSRALETASYVPLGQYSIQSAVRKGISGIVPAGAQVYWNIRKP
ncbi:MAG: ABC transporter substrate-binding protein, partial [Burkholderiales bacterium]|nr:ABC transporter substrate-binding protein [Burkholderiales bacterium]